MPLARLATLETLMMRDEGAILGRRRLVRRKGPRWFVASWDSWFEGVVRVYGGAIIAALLMRVFMGEMEGSRRMAEAAARMLEGRERSMGMKVVVVVGEM